MKFLLYFKKNKNPIGKTRTFCLKQKLPDIPRSKLKQQIPMRRSNLKLKLADAFQT